MGDMNDKTDREPASDRCVIDTDAGYTKADSGNNSNRFFCIHFAHGNIYIYIYIMCCRNNID